jgi:hypothetical protein
MFENPDLANYSMPSRSQEDIVAVLRGADFLIEPTAHRSVQVSHEESGWFYKIRENPQSNHLSPDILEFP